MQQFHSHGKLLITGEYAVLDGATALALPTKFGQSLEVKSIEQPVIKWKSLDHNEKVWFAADFEIKDLHTREIPPKHKKDEVSKMLFLTLFSAAEMAPEIVRSGNGFEITAKIDFPRNWGLGTSSTLIANLSKWLKIDPYTLLKDTFGGSGYDVAVAMQGTAITYQKKGLENSILKTSFDPPFKEHLFFVFLNRKQNSRESIQHYREQKNAFLETSTEKVSSLTQSFITCTELREFELLMEVHENFISKLTGLKKVKSELFPDYNGAVKSLGGWGGDFVLATGNDSEMDYFRNKGFDTILSYKEMIHC